MSILACTLGFAYIRIGIHHFEVVYCIKEKLDVFNYSFLIRFINNKP